MQKKNNCAENIIKAETELFAFIVSCILFLFVLGSKYQYTLSMCKHRFLFCFFNKNKNKS